MMMMMIMMMMICHRSCLSTCKLLLYMITANCSMQVIIIFMFQPNL